MSFKDPKLPRATLPDGRLSVEGETKPYFRDLRTAIHLRVAGQITRSYSDKELFTSGDDIGRTTEVYVSETLTGTVELEDSHRGLGESIMFNWFRKKERKEDLKAAFDQGQRIGESMSAEIEAYMQEHFYPSIPPLADAVFGSFEDPNMPPFVLARMDLKIYLDGLDNQLRSWVLPQLRTHMAGWLSVGTEFGTEIEILIDHHFNQFKSALASAAYQHLLDMTDFLREADDGWRTANPEKAAQIPPDAFCSELAEALQAFSIEEVRQTSPLADYSPEAIAMMHRVMTEVGLDDPAAFERALEEAAPQDTLGEIIERAYVKRGMRVPDRIVEINRNVRRGGAPSRR
jgi:hypothetical protein